jgi:hypothetical protein
MSKEGVRLWWILPQHPVSTFTTPNHGSKDRRTIFLFLGFSPALLERALLIFFGNFITFFLTKRYQSIGHGRVFSKTHSHTIFGIIIVFVVIFG